MTNFTRFQTKVLRALAGKRQTLDLRVGVDTSDPEQLSTLIHRKKQLDRLVKFKFLWSSGYLYEITNDGVKAIEKK